MAFRCCLNKLGGVLEDVLSAAVLQTKFIGLIY